MACGCVDWVGRSYSVSSMKCRPLTHEMPGLMIIMYHETWPLLQSATKPKRKCKSAKVVS